MKNIFVLLQICLRNTEFDITMYRTELMINDGIPFVVGISIYLLLILIMDFFTYIQIEKLKSIEFSSDHNKETFTGCATCTSNENDKIYSFDCFIFKISSNKDYAVDIPIKATSISSNLYLFLICM